MNDTTLRTPLPSAPAPRGRNPLARAALAMPPALGWWLSLVGRGAAAGLALVIAVDQSYTRTRVLAVALAVVILLSFVPLMFRFAQRFPWVGAGVAFFGGSLLWFAPSGKLMLLAGALAGLGAALDDVHAGRMTGVASFFTGFGLTLVMVAAIVLGIDG
jgi:hypothetical protein